MAAPSLILLAATSMHTFVRPLAEWAFLRFALLYISRVDELLRGLECLFRRRTGGALGTVSNTRTLRDHCRCGRSGRRGVRSARRSRADAALRGADASRCFACSLAEADRVWPLPNGRLARPATILRRYDPFSGHLGSHALAEEYFSTGPEAYARTLPIERSLPLLHAMAVGIYLESAMVLEGAGKLKNSSRRERPEQERMVRLLWRSPPARSPSCLTLGPWAFQP